MQQRSVVPGPDEEPSLFRFWSPCVSVARSSPRDILRIRCCDPQLIVHWVSCRRVRSTAQGVLDHIQDNSRDNQLGEGNGPRYEWCATFVVGNIRTAMTNGTSTGNTMWSNALISVTVVYAARGTGVPLAAVQHQGCPILYLPIIIFWFSCV